jgi:hypothetical protein
MIVGAARDVHGVAVPVVTLPGKISAGMAVEAARVHEYRHHLLEESRGSGIR